ncbi:MAG TPA: prepilin-type N-terminal cleavage/methylation domain-containing protein, partial [Verrucomicrobiae bacterium]|nr:prepilin-type N-terminal cleavage/methylation domain-containing protein [Verrucomicrobiae bacterium]
MRISPTEETYQETPALRRCSPASRPAQKKGRVCNGFTLVEVMVSVLVVAVMTFSLYAAFSYGFTVVQMTREDLRATQILMQRMEGIRL